MKVAKVKQDSLAELPVKTPAQQSVAIPALAVVMGLKEEIIWTKKCPSRRKGTSEHVRFNWFLLLSRVLRILCLAL